MKNLADPAELAKYQEHIKAHGIEHFSARECLTLRRAGYIAPVPPRDLWHRIIPTLLIAEEIRAEMGHALVVGNGYRSRDLNRAVGGSRRSQHIQNAALDLDLPNSENNRENRRKFYAVACEFWRDHGRDSKMGLGLYSRHGGSRIHIDTGRTWGYRTWKRGYAKQILDSLR